MTDYAADNVSGTAGAISPPRTGSASADTIPAGALMFWRNSGAGAHVVTLANNSTQDGLAVTARTIPLAAGQVKIGRVNPAWGDANGRVAVGIDGTATEVTYHVLGNV